MPQPAVTRVLVVDGNPRDVIAVRKLLANLGTFEVLTAPTAERGLQLLQEHPVDALVVDQALPNRSGTELVRLALEDGFQGAVIVTATEIDRAAAAATLQLGVANYIIKTPTWLTSLPELLVRAIERTRLVQQNRELMQQVRELMQQNRELARQNRELQEKVGIVEQERDALNRQDPLTSLCRGWYFEECRSREASRSKRLGRPLTTAEFRVPHPARLRAMHGKRQFENWLQLVASAISRVVRTTDVAAHFGNGHFKALLLDCDPAGAQIVISRIMEIVESFKQEGSMPAWFEVNTVAQVVGETAPTGSTPPPSGPRTAETPGTGLKDVGVATIKRLTSAFGGGQTGERPSGTPEPRER